MQILIPQNLPIGYGMEYSQYHNTSKQQTKNDTSRESNQVEEETQKQNKNHLILKANTEHSKYQQLLIMGKRIKEKTGNRNFLPASYN